jgi:2-oxo-3-hexenedioate decarboxylase
VTLAQDLDRAQRTATAIEQPGVPDVAAAYAVQHELIAARRERGERLAGGKLGFTSTAKAAQMGVHDVIAGQLTDAMRVAEGGTIRLGRFIHPRAEPEIAFRLLVSDSDGAVSADAVAPAVEIIDSRYRDFRFSLPDVIADDASAAAFAVGHWQPLTGQDFAGPDFASRDLGNRAVVLALDGAPAQIGSTAAILGQPFRALAAYGRLAREHGLPLRTGDVLLAGAATAAVPFTAGVVTVRVAGLGEVTVRGTDD